MRDIAGLSPSDLTDILQNVHDLHIAGSNAQLSFFSSTFFSLMTALQVPKMKLTEQVGGVED